MLSIALAGFCMCIVGHILTYHVMADMVLRSMYFAMVDSWLGGVKL